MFVFSLYMRAIDQNVHSAEKQLELQQKLFVFQQRAFYAKAGNVPGAESFHVYLCFFSTTSKSTFTHVCQYISHAHTKSVHV